MIHTCIELIDPRPGLGRVATLLGAMVVVRDPEIYVTVRPGTRAGFEFHRLELAR
jgi:hypothetical protein